MWLTSGWQELGDMGLSASMRRSLGRDGNLESSQLDLGLSQSMSFDTKTLCCINIISSVCVVRSLGADTLCVCVRIYITTRQLFYGAVFGLQAEDSLLDLHQLTPQGVLLSQDAGDHGLGLISGQVCLEAKVCFYKETTVHSHSLCTIHTIHKAFCVEAKPPWRPLLLNLWGTSCNSKRGYPNVLVIHCLNCFEVSMHMPPTRRWWYAGRCQCGACGWQPYIFWHNLLNMTF